MADMTSIMNNIKVRFPNRRKKGGQTKGSMQLYQDSLRFFVEDLLAVQDKLDFHMGARDWCYALEPCGLPKGDFNWMQEQIGEARALGLLKPGFILEEEGHEVERQDDDDYSVALHIQSEYEDWLNAEKSFEDCWKSIDVSFWEDQKYYIQLLVEKAGLKSLFRKICDKYKIPMANMRGWGSMEQKAKMAHNFKAAEARGQIPVLLTCGDFDPAGLKISSILKETFKKYEIFNDWNSDNLIVERIGLSYNFIQENSLTWIDGLETVSGKDMANPKHEFWKSNTYGVQEYVENYGKRKCEANAIVVIPDLGRKILVDKIEDYLGEDVYEKYQEKVLRKVEEAKKIIEEYKERAAQ